MNIDEFDSLQDILGRTEYVVKNRAIESSADATTQQKLCGSCNDVCVKCNGPTEDDCLACESDYNQIIIGSKITCHPKKPNNASITAVITESPNDDNKLNGIANHLKNYSIEKIVLVSSIIGILLMTISISIYLIFIKCDCDFLASIYGKSKQFMNRASTTNGGGGGAEREKYSYNIVEMEEKFPLTVALPCDYQINHDDDDYYDDDEEDSDVE